ncbi:unnamed protein product [[Candida] boidinii]|nr:unnamed protein product [[Candida] boidinii]
MPVPVHQYINQEQPKHQQQFSQHAIQRPTTSGHTRDQTHFTPFKPHSTISNNWDQSPASSFSQPTVTTVHSPQSSLPGKVASHLPATGHFQAYSQPQATSQPAAGPTGDLNNSQRTSKCPTYETF